MSETERALAQELNVRPYLDRDAGFRQMFSEGFRSGWLARTANTDAVMVTREYLDDLERRVSIQEITSGPVRPEGSVS